MKVTWIESHEQLVSLVESLEDQKEIAVDLEAVHAAWIGILCSLLC